MVGHRTIAALATAAGTLTLAVATLSSTRSANRAARVSEQALKIGLRPVLFNARPEDPPQKVSYIDSRWVRLRDGLAAVQAIEDSLYLAIPLRNVAAGLAGTHGWQLPAERTAPPGPPEDFRRLQRDLYVPAGDINFWQAALGRAATPPRPPARGDPRAARDGRGHPLRRPRGRSAYDHALLPDTAHPRHRRRALAVGLTHLPPLEPRPRRPPLGSGGRPPDGAVLTVH